MLSLHYILLCFRWLPWRCFRSSSTLVLSPEMPPQSSLQSRYKRLRNAVLVKITAAQRFNSSSISGLTSPVHFPVRYDLDACDIQEKYPDLFQVNLNIEVDPRDKPSTKPPPWEGFQTKGLNPKILFSTRDEQQEILSKFGKGCSSLKTSVVFLTRCTSKANIKQKSLQASPSCLVSPVPLRSMTPRRPSRLRLQKAPLQLSQNLLRATIPTLTISSRHWTGKVPYPSSHFTVNSKRPKPSDGH